MERVERADGWWWVRWRCNGPDEGWQCANVDGEHVVFADMYEDVNDPGIEWGSYLGRNPGDTDSEVLKRLDIDTRFT
jgi:hypothetical protein